MTAPIFVDTNVFVYARDASEPSKQPAAESWVRSLWLSGRGRLSTQVLHELYVTLTRKLRPGLPRDVAREEVRELQSWRPVAITADVLDEAWVLEDRFGLSFWDALVVAAARVAGCGAVLSEDLQDGQDFDGVVVVDPFAHAPSELGA